MITKEMVQAQWRIEYLKNQHRLIRHPDMTIEERDAIRVFLKMFGRSMAYDVYGFAKVWEAEYGVFEGREHDGE